MTETEEINMKYNLFCDIVVPELYLKNQVL